MTVPTREFQPEAERYYAQGYWQEGDLCSVRCLQESALRPVY